ncbi:MAG TPA: universal stress protein [Gaiellaceae bacterium]|nr:universal stress protein [Gaiellaceae bacterium]
MRNPLRSEADAFRFVLYTIGYFALIVVAALAHPALGLLVFVGLTGTILWRVLGTRGRVEEREVVVPAPTAEGERRILVIANETVGGGELLDVIRERAAGVSEQVLVVVPALNSPLKHWASDDDAARAEARERLEASLARLREAGIEARGEVGDGDPLQAIDDALRTFGADEIVISTHPEGRSNWLERGVVTAARDRFAAPITHVVVDVDAST